MRTFRLFKILDWLRSQRGPITAERLACELEVSVRTIYRDMLTLQEMGTPIRGEGGIGYQIEKGYFLPPLQFDSDELEALFFGIRMVSARGDRIIRPLGLTAFETVWVLTAWCEKRSDFRNFRVDRIEDVEIKAESFPREKGKEFSDYLKTL